ncbi:hypothetical protein BX616_006035 [Lobosporangium transversale]|uniref:Pentacotripeptide-repeat region of PRORP domain-containing protein n=1 Tax=Lobosporangium transversale TaxID=64571 RepID=A0A1Y2H090_9FUNG|nr:hypothetical protein BCR41DRAFT_419524 [Lobosporangium transversale]KAF9915495.1 hypothetical protein BX616_006035 [Lobosporangium transversale]ORZ27123.1 hypothetical protein BCR41DRAFT_419524 [Lobosporangium transversale]|eukprot:XP_021884870.1 hypothetical protein BCR41DRAFT_419524 [Lobosporangium transversale]
MSQYVCRQCALSFLLRRGASKIAGNPRIALSDAQTPALFIRTFCLPQQAPSRYLSSSIPGRSLPEPVAIGSSVSTNLTDSRTSRLKTTIRPVNPSSLEPLQDLEASRQKRIRMTRKRIYRFVRYLEVDKLYLEFWKTCCTETLDDQREIWRSSNDKPDLLTTQEAVYRAFNSSSPPTHSVYPVWRRKLKDGRPFPRFKLTVEYESAQKPMVYTLAFIDQSHARRLLQMHQYFEEVLGIKAGYRSMIALLVAFSSRGDMATTLTIFNRWRENQQFNQSGGKEMYSSVIRGLVGRNCQSSPLDPHSLAKNNRAGIRNQGVTQIYAALELFYDMLRQGCTPTFETYHSLIVGLSTFKNDMEAAELLLDHMIIMKKKPYVQVLHVICREYVRRRDFPSAERIFRMLKEYRIRPKALTCNLMLKAVFQMSDADAALYLGKDEEEEDQLEDIQARGRRLKHKKIKEIHDYMVESGVLPDEVTFSIQFYGYGHMEDGYSDLRAVMTEMANRQGLTIEPNMIILNSLLFAHINHGKLKMAESILDQMLQSTHPVNRARADSFNKKQQVRSPFLNPQEGEDIDLFDGDEQPRTRRRRLKDSASLEGLRMIPGKGAFHALMLAYVDQGDIIGMERVLDKMIGARKHLQQECIQTSPHLKQSEYRAAFPRLNLDADEYTANIMLLGYIMQRDYEKVELIRQQILSRLDWTTSASFAQREQYREQLIAFVQQQSSRSMTKRFLQDDVDDDDGALSRFLFNSSSPSKGVTQGIGSCSDAKACDPRDKNIESDLDDSIEIDITTLSAKLRCLLNSTATSQSSSSS